MILTTIIAYLVAGASMAALITLWFWIVRQELCAKQKAAKAAKCQLIASKQEYLRARDGSNETQAHEILERSERVYKQSIQLYQKSLRKPWNLLPGALMGFGKEIQEDHFSNFLFF